MVKVLILNAFRFIPNIDSEEAAECIYRSTILEGQEEVYLWWYFKYLNVILDLVPVWIRDLISEQLLSKRIVAPARKSKSG